MGAENAFGKIQYHEFEDFRDKNTQQPKNRRELLQPEKGHLSTKKTPQLTSN